MDSKLKVMKRMIKASLVLFLIALIIGISAVHAGNALVVTATIKVGMFPEGIAYDSGKGELFVANWLSDSVSVISDSNNSVVANVTVGSNPDGIAYDSAKNEVFITNYASSHASGTVSVISDVNNSVVATIPVGTYPDGIAYDSANGKIFVSNYGSNTVSIILDSNNSVVATVSVDDKPVGVVYDSGRNEVFVANSYNPYLTIISGSNNTVITDLLIGQNSYISPFYLAYDSAKAEIFITTNSALDEETGSHTVLVLSDSSNSIVATITAGFNSNGITYSGKGEIFTANYPDNSVSVISDNTNSVIANVTVGTNPIGVAYDSGKNEIFVSNAADHTVSVILDSTGTAISPTATLPEFPISIIALIIVFLASSIGAFTYKRKHALR